MKLLNRQNMSRKKSENKTGESHACEQTREDVWFESDIFFFSFSFNLNSRLLERRRLLLGSRHSVHMPTYLTDVDPPVNDAYLLRCLATV